MKMKTPTILVTVLTVAAIGGAPAVASAATSCPDGGDCRIALNHNEILVASSAGSSHAGLREACSGLGREL